MALKKTDYTIMSFNLRFGLADDGANSWSNRKLLCAQLLKLYPSTFIGVQESNHFQTGFLIQNLKDHDFIGWHNQSREQWQSNLIFYHNTWECLKAKHYFLSHTPDVESTLPGSKWPRQCVIGLFQKDGYHLIVANTHFDFLQAVQEKSAALVIGFLSQFPRDCPIIITGDFNSNPGSKTHAFFQAHGFFDAFENNHSTTFHNFTGEETKDHIDWILYCGNIKIVRRKIITDSFSGRYPSDHYPVMAAFQESGDLHF